MEYHAYKVEETSLQYFFFIFSLTMKNLLFSSL